MFIKILKLILVVLFLFLTGFNPKVINAQYQQWASFYTGIVQNSNDLSEWIVLDPSNNSYVTIMS